MSKWLSLLITVTVLWGCGSAPTPLPEEGTAWLDENDPRPAPATDPLGKAVSQYCAQPYFYDQECAGFTEMRPVEPVELGRFEYSILTRGGDDYGFPLVAYDTETEEIIFIGGVETRFAGAPKISPDGQFFVDAAIAHLIDGQPDRSLQRLYAVELATGEVQLLDNTSAEVGLLVTCEALKLGCQWNEATAWTDDNTFTAHTVKLTDDQPPQLDESHEDVRTYTVEF